ncbi:MAG TPA: ribulose-phosphate 3-epimerase [Firmicutes bacterium]|nr:ribulose-phosphate 3-epimerase [Bacillota bacterium]HBM70814.1 ribulose-phosphate 3-epimerase [Bacillota bacterium]HBX24917.1 ribulose-phosphate 3-epimerase [Bacillota bacterium]
MSLVSPSILSANFSSLHLEVEKMVKAGASYIHLDVMDGIFVPNKTFDASLLRQIRDINVIKDTHLMVTSPFKEIEEFAKEGSDIITVHVEAFENDEMCLKALKRIKDLDVLPGLSIKPGTKASSILKFLPYVGLILIMSVEPGKGGQSFMDSSLEKISFFSKYKKEHDVNYKIEVDGGINLDTGKKCVEAGADILVAGSYLYGHADYQKRLKGLLEL